MRYAFYDSQEYRDKQRERTLRNQKKGIYTHLRKETLRICMRTECSISFSVIVSSPKVFCSRSCAGKVNNLGRTLSDKVRKKIGKSQKGKKSPFKGIIKVPRASAICMNLKCAKPFVYEQYKTRKFCSVACAMKVTGSKPTSSKASRGKAGIRKDIHPTISFRSRWEANIARLYVHLGIAWIYESTSFDIGDQTYTPDFYLPASETYIEIKNFWNEYSRTRDEKFRKKYKKVRLEVIGKKEYLALEKRYAKYIPSWEFNNSTFSA